MKLSRRRFLHLTACAAALPAISRIAKAQTFPSRPITLVVGYRRRLRPTRVKDRHATTLHFGGKAGLGIGRKSEERRAGNPTCHHLGRQRACG
jgi:hypothetical protein